MNIIHYQMEYGKRICCGFIEVMKYRRVVRDGRVESVPGDMEDGLPYISVAEKGGSWELHYSAGTRMFSLIDYLDTETDGDGRLRFSGDVEKGISVVLESMLAMCSVMGDGELVRDRIECFGRFVARSATAQDPGESASDIQDVADTDRIAAVLAGIADEALSDEDGKEG